MIRKKNTERLILKQKGTRMAANGDDWNGLEITILKSLANFFKIHEWWRSSFKAGSWFEYSDQLYQFLLHYFNSASPQANSRYLSKRRRLGTEHDSQKAWHKMAKKAQFCEKRRRHCSTKICFLLRESGNISAVLVTYIPSEHLRITVDGRNEMWLPFFWLKLDTWPRSAILDLLFIARRPRRVLPSSFTGDITTKLTGDNRGQGWLQLRGKKPTFTVCLLLPGSPWQS